MIKKFYTKKGEFPEQGEYVLGRVLGKPWLDNQDINGNRFWQVVRFCKGLSKQERAALSDNDHRKREYRTGDEDGNNKVGWEWSEFGPGSYFGQEIEVWYRLSDLEKE